MIPRIPVAGPLSSGRLYDIRNAWRLHDHW